MATDRQQEALVAALAKLQALQDQGREGFVASDFSRRDLERLTGAGFLSHVIRGWYVAANPADRPGDSTPWYAHQMGFIRDYANHRFGDEWSLSPEDSLLAHSGHSAVRKQVIVHSTKGTNNVINLPFDTKLIEIKSTEKTPNLPNDKGMRLQPLNYALSNATPRFFVAYPQDAHIALGMVQDASQLLHVLLPQGKTHVAGRLVGALRAIGRKDMGDEIISAMRTAGFFVQESNPFEHQPTNLFMARQSPYVNRLNLMWSNMREGVLKAFDGIHPAKVSASDYLANVQENYVLDAYHSMSIEGYRVTPALIERVATGRFNPQDSEADRTDRNAMAARGYYDTFMLVKESIHKILNGENSGQVAKRDHQYWYRALFGPSVQAGILDTSHLIGYRGHQVFIRNSMHTPPSADAVRDLMPAYFDLLTNEPEPAVRAVLAHFCLGYIHPWMDGNGRMARFMMNVQFASGNYPWVIIRVEDRDQYMKALESASYENNIEPFAGYVAQLMRERLENK
ncbi:Fic family protein [Alcaligenaceae bacterium]|nr:Fic family protein [Alcaligenaceae bacterium]